MLVEPEESRGLEVEHSRGGYVLGLLLYLRGLKRKFKKKKVYFDEDLKTCII
jgi:hypothetical protein